MSRLALSGVPRNGLDRKTAAVICGLELAATCAGLPHLIEATVYLIARRLSDPLLGGTDRACIDYGFQGIRSAPPWTLSEVHRS